MNKRFTEEEDKILKRAIIAAAINGRKRINVKRLASQLGRTKQSISYRIWTLRKER